MSEALSQIQKLERYVQSYGEDPFISMTLSKMLDYKIQKYKRDLEEIESDMSKFEEKYEMDSGDFYKVFRSGKLGDDMDFVEWSSLYRMKKRIEERKGLLES